jgi:hypothetical protein
MGNLKRLLNWIKNSKFGVWFFSRKLGRNMMWFLFSLLFGILMFYLLTVVIGPFQPMSRFPAAFLLIYIGVACLMFLDNVYFHQIDTIEELKAGNKAYALVLLAYAVIIAAVLSSV